LARLTGKERVSRENLLVTFKNLGNAFRSDCLSRAAGKTFRPFPILAPLLEPGPGKEGEVTVFKKVGTN
jgi:hypothetical protein